MKFLFTMLFPKGKLDLGGNDFDMAILENIVLEKHGFGRLKTI